MCGVLELLDLDAKANVVPEACDMLAEMDNRGGDTTGLGVLGQQRIGRGKWSFERCILEGRASEVLESVRETMSGFSVIGQTRYRTQGKRGTSAAQPIGSDGLFLAHNGNAETTPLRRALQRPKGRYPSDSYLMHDLLVQELENARGDVARAVRAVWPHIVGAHNVVFARNTGEAGGWKDEEDKHPLFLARKGSKVAITSEDFAARKVWGDQTRIEEIDPGCLVQMKLHAEPTVVRIADVMRSSCSFELIYFLKRFSHFLGIEASHARHRAGEELAKLDADFWSAQNIVPMVVPVPQSSKYVAQGYTDELDSLGIFEFLGRNAQFGRTFIADESVRKFLADQKYWFRFQELIRGQHLLIVEDSIVRSTTLRALLDRIRALHPASIHVRSAFPPVVAPCFDGINMSTVDELFYSQYRRMLLDGATQEEIQEQMASDLAIDSLRYLPVTLLPKVLNVPEDELCWGCTRGVYSRPSRQKLFDLKLGAWEKKQAKK